LRHTIFRIGVAGILSSLSPQGTGAQGGGSAKELNMELGGLFTLDYLAPAATLEDPVLEIGTAELGANLGLSRDLTASVMLETEGGLDHLAIGQAAATLRPAQGPWTLVFGQHALAHGLLTTRLPSDPLLLDRVELIQAGGSAIWSGKRVSLGLGGFVRREGTPSDLQDEEAIHSDPVAVWNVDLLSEGETTARLSFTASANSFTADAAASLSAGRFDLDAEAYHEFASPPGHGRAAGAYAGAAWNLFPTLFTAVRVDILGDGTWARLEGRLAGGLVYHRGDGLFAAVECGYGAPPDGRRDLDAIIQVGLESTLELPGFRRKTLTQD
jgi:hypothetical protein